MTYPNNLRPKAQIVGTHIFVIYKVLPTLFLRYMPNHFAEHIAALYKIAAKLQHFFVLCK